MNEIHGYLEDHKKGCLIHSLFERSEDGQCKGNSFILRMQKAYNRLEFKKMHVDRLLCQRSGNSSIQEV